MCQAGLVATPETFDDFADYLDGPFGVAFRHAGVLVQQKLTERGCTLGDLPDQQVADLLHAALLETAAVLHPGHEGRSLRRRLDAVFAAHALDLAASVRPPATVQ